MISDREDYSFNRDIAYDSLIRELSLKYVDDSTDNDVDYEDDATRTYNATNHDVNAYDMYYHQALSIP